MGVVARPGVKGVDVLPPRDHPQWGELVDHPDQFNLSLLALKIFMHRVVHQAGSSPHSRAAAIDDLYDFFVKNEPQLGADIMTIFESGEV